MAVLVETHTHQEIEDAMEIEPRIIGVNARNLKTLEINLNAFAELIPEIPSSIIRVAESGISARSEVEIAQSAGAQAILVGETLVKSGDPRAAIDQLLGRTR
jgi:indole-3-glycerol phosphate synthase